MKRKILLSCLLLAVLGIFGGCSNQRTEKQLAVSEASALELNLQQDSEDFIWGEDDWYSCTNQQRLYCSDGSLTYSIMQDVLNVWDVEDNEQNMCELRACSHSDETCVAYVGHLKPVYLAFYMDYLYLVAQEESDVYALYRFEINEKNNVTQREYITAVQTYSAETPEFMVHRGYLYYTDGSELYRVELNPNMKSEQLYKGTAALSELHGYGNWVYMCDSSGAVYCGQITQAEWTFGTVATGADCYALSGTQLYYLPDETSVMCVNIQNGTADGEPECIYTAEEGTIQALCGDAAYLIVDETDKDGNHTIVILSEENCRMDLSAFSGMLGSMMGIYPLTEQVIFESGEPWGGFNLSAFLERNAGVYTNIGVLLE